MIFFLNLFAESFVRPLASIHFNLQQRYYLSLIALDRIQLVFVTIPFHVTTLSPLLCQHFPVELSFFGGTCTYVKKIFSTPGTACCPMLIYIQKKNDKQSKSMTVIMAPRHYVPVIVLPSDRTLVPVTYLISLYGIYM